MNSSCIEDFAPFTDVKSLRSNDFKDLVLDDQNPEDLFNQIPEVDEEYLGSN